MPKNPSTSENSADTPPRTRPAWRNPRTWLNPSVWVLPVTILVILAVSVIGSMKPREQLAPPPPATTGVHGDKELIDVMKPYVPKKSSKVAALVVTPEESKEALFGTTATSQMWVGSLSKLLTVQLFASSLSRGEVTHDTTLGEVFDMGDSPAASITLNELAHHESGLGTWGNDEQAGVPYQFRTNILQPGQDPNPVTFQQLLDRAKADPLSARGNYHYSNIGIALLGHALAKKADTDYSTLLKNRLLKPLDMNGTYVPGPGSLNTPRGFTETGIHAPVWNMGAYAPGGGIVSTLMDLGRFARAVAADPAEGLENTDQIVYRGFAHEEFGHRHILYKSGEVSGFSSAIVIDPKAHTAVVVLSDDEMGVIDAAKVALAAHT